MTASKCSSYQESLPSRLEQEIESSLGSQPLCFLDVSISAAAPWIETASVCTSFCHCCEGCGGSRNRLRTSVLLHDSRGSVPLRTQLRLRAHRSDVCSWVRTESQLATSDNEIINSISDSASTDFLHTVHGAHGETGLERLYQEARTSELKILANNDIYI